MTFKVGDRVQLKYSTSPYMLVQDICGNRVQCVYASVHGIFKEWFDRALLEKV